MGSVDSRPGMARLFGAVLCLGAAWRGCLSIEHHRGASAGEGVFEILVASGREELGHELVRKHMGEYWPVWQQVQPSLTEPVVLVLHLPAVRDFEVSAANQVAAKLIGPLTALVSPSVVCSLETMLETQARFPDRPVFGLELHLAGLDAALPEFAGMANLVSASDLARLWSLPE